MKNRWSLVIHEVSAHTANIWVGTLFADMRKPVKAVVELVNQNGDALQKIEIAKQDWQRPYRQITSQRFYRLIEVKGLQPGQFYKVVFKECFDDDNEFNDKLLSKGSFTTLPYSVNDLVNGFTIGLGSCFYEEYDGGSVSTAYETLSKATQFPYKPHIKFLSGDQVYLDIGWDSLSVIPKEVRDRVASDYALQWQALRGVLRHGGTWFLSDDHEFWNNYPMIEGWSPFIQALRIPSVKNAWKGTAQDGVMNIQRVRPVRTFDIGAGANKEVSFCAVDLRAFRTEQNIMSDKHFAGALRWVKQLTCPGVLVLSQPLMEKYDHKDRNFIFYQRQYGQLLRAIHNANHDIMVLSGDVHHGRISKVEFPNRTNKLVEVVSSPMSNLSGESSIATSTINIQSRLKRFPDINVYGVPKVDVQYQSPWKVSTADNFFDFRYWDERTKEHFNTLTLNKLEDGKLEVTVRAWLVREKDHKTGLPKQDWGEKPMRFVLS
ncbi:MAG: hypothetical protein HWE10_11675 [Gammaproteobacteria bacterium]|nr:hypothetical protein [Gammaproteobacteria bacterium]